MTKKTKNYLINIGSGKDYTIKYYANFINKAINANIKIIFDKYSPDGTPRKILDNALAKKYGWSAKTDLKSGFQKTFEDFLKNNS